MSVKGKQVLIIDDVADLRLRCRKTLESFGIVVFEASSTPDGLEYISRAKKLPDLIVLDLQMKGKSGFDFLSARKASLSISGVPVIVSSGLSDRVSVAKAIALGADDYIVKPINATLLLQRIRKHLRGEGFEEVSLDATDSLKVSITLEASITKIERTAFTLESPARISKGTLLILPPEALVQLKLSAVVFESRSEPGPMTMTGAYQTQVEVIGLSDPVQSKAPRG